MLYCVCTENNTPHNPQSLIQICPQNALRTVSVQNILAPNVLLTLTMLCELQVWPPQCSVCMSALAMLCALTLCIFCVFVYFSLAMLRAPTSGSVFLVSLLAPSSRSQQWKSARNGNPPKMETMKIWHFPGQYFHKGPAHTFEIK